MCGICCSIFTGNDQKNNLNKDLEDLLKNRGPDCCRTLCLNKNILFHGFVLWQQGGSPTAQPINSNNYVLLLNGDIFNSNKTEESSDTSWLLGKLDECRSDDDVVRLFVTLNGPYSIVFYKKDENAIFFARDSLGRNSLLIERDGLCLRILSTSIMEPKRQKKTIELPPLGLFKYFLDKKETILYPWSKETTKIDSHIESIENILQSKIIIKKSTTPDWLLSTNNDEPAFSFHQLLEEFDETKYIFEEFLKIKKVNKTVNEIMEKLESSVRDRVANTPKYCSSCINKNLAEDIVNCVHAKIGILFSGGLDCTVLAALAHKLVPLSDPIDLINVAFQKPLKNNLTDKIDWNVPDRLSARDSYEELRSLFPERKWNLVEVNVPRTELDVELKNHIKHLVYPLTTVLDESLGCTFWFAARGRGLVKDMEYQSNCRIILIGSGADELFGGYTRHRNAFIRTHGGLSEKVEALREELQMDWERIPMRNLGRDDRIIADRGKTARAPYIEENLTKFVTNLHPLEKCCFDLSQGVGDKLILRLCAHEIGLRVASTLKKRAIQFGSRIADKNQNAKDISLPLTT